MSVLREAGTCVPARASDTTACSKNMALGRNLMVVNRSPFQNDALPVDVSLHGFTGTGSATVRQVAPAAFTSHNDAETPNAVTLSTSTRAVGTNTFRATFPPFSITLFILPPA